MDDLEAPEEWDEKLLDVLPAPYEAGEWPDGIAQRMPEIEKQLQREHVIDLTGESTEWVVYSALTRARYERIGYILHPDFESMYADNYYSEIAHRDGVVINGRGLGFRHNHPTNGRTAIDDVYAQQNRPAAYRQGLATYRKLTQGTRVIAMCFPGETFSHRVASSITKLLRYLDQGPRFIAEEYWFHCSNVYRTRIELAAHVTSGGEIEGTGARPDLIYWQDDDNPVAPEHFEMLLATLDAHPAYGIVAGWCWCDTGDYEDQPFRMSCGRQGPNLECEFFGVEEYLKLKASGKLAITSDDVAPDAVWSGFPVVLMRASVLETLGWRAFKPMLGEDFVREFTSEDTTFFYRAHQAGIKTAIDLRVKVPHFKLRAIEPQILPASERDKFMELVKSVEQAEVPVPV